MATVCFLGLDSEGIAQLAEGLARGRSEGEFSTDAANVVAYDRVSKEVREALATSRHPVEPLSPRPPAADEVEHHQQVVVLGFRNAQGFVPLPPGVKASLEVWPIEPPEDEEDPMRRMRGIRRSLERRLARLVHDLRSPDRECCDSGCTNCVRDR